MITTTTKEEREGRRKGRIGRRGYRGRTLESGFRLRARAIFFFLVSFVFFFFLFFSPRSYFSYLLAREEMASGDGSAAADWPTFRRDYGHIHVGGGRVGSGSFHGFMRATRNARDGMSFRHCAYRYAHNRRARSRSRSCSRSCVYLSQLYPAFDFRRSMAVSITCFTTTKDRAIFAAITSFLPRAANETAAISLRRCIV